MRTGTIALAVVCGLLLPGAVAVAEASCDPADAAERTEAIRRHLDREARTARRWNVGWGLTFGGLAALQAAGAYFEYTPLGDFDDDKQAGLYVNAGKAAIGSLAHVVLPLKVVRAGTPSGDACADLEAAERALRKTAQNEKKSFYLNHAGALALNVGGMLLLGMGFDTWKEGGMSIALGYPMGLLHAYTQPRRTWKAVRRGALLSPPVPRVSWQLGAVRRPGYTGLVLDVTF